MGSPVLILDLQGRPGRHNSAGSHDQRPFQQGFNRWRMAGRHLGMQLHLMKLKVCLPSSSVSLWAAGESATERCSRHPSCPLPFPSQNSTKVHLTASQLMQLRRSVPHDYGIEYLSHASSPDECHLGPQPKLAARLLHPVLGARQHPAQHLGDVVVRHAHAVVLHTTHTHTIAAASCDIILQ